MSTTTTFAPVTIAVSRTLNVSVERVWDLWTKPELLKTWWGPHGFTNPQASIRPVVGGKVDIVMRGYGKDYPMHGTVETVEAPNCLVFTAFAGDGDGNDVLSGQMTIVLEARDEGCEMSIHEVITPLSEQGAMMASMGQQGLEQSLDRLEGLALSNDRELVIVRLIDAPAAAIREAWLNSEQLKQWFAPGEMQTPIAEIDARPGGRFDITMRDPQGTDYVNRGVFLELSPNRIVTTDGYTEGWIPSDNPFMTTILTFEEVGAKTRYTATVRHWRSEDRERHETIGFFDGWGQATDKLAQLVTGK